MKLKDAKILLTGGSTGIGKETARALKGKGASVVICSKNRERLETAAKELDIDYVVADVSKEEDVIRAVAHAKDTMGGLDTLINNAGYGTFSPLLETSVEDFQGMWETNTKGAFMMGRECAKTFAQQSFGNIVNIASTAARKGFASGSGYCASKFGLSALSECWRYELRKYNVRVMQLNPSEVITPFYKHMDYDPGNAKNKLVPSHIAHTIVSMLEMDNVGFIPETSVWATNP